MKPLINVLIILTVSILLGLLIIPRLKKGKYSMEGGVVQTHIHTHTHKTKNIVIIISMSILMVGGLLALVYQQVGPPAAKKAAVEQASTTSTDIATAKVNELTSKLETKVDNLITKVDRIFDPNTDFTHAQQEGLLTAIDRKLPVILAAVIGSRFSNGANGRKFNVKFNDGTTYNDVAVPEVSSTSHYG